MDAIVAKKWKIRHTAQVESLVAFLVANDKPHAIALLLKIKSKANESEIYRNRIITWLDGEADFNDVASLCSPFARLDDQAIRNNVFLLNRTLISLK